MLCPTCGAKRFTSVQRCKGDINMLHNTCHVCDVHKITIEHGHDENSVLGVIRAVEHIRKALEGSGWRVGSIKSKGDE